MTIKYQLVPVSFCDFQLKIIDTHFQRCFATYSVRDLEHGLYSSTVQCYGKILLTFA